MIFAERSPRYVDIEQAKEVIPTPLQYVGVFQNHDIEAIIKVAETLGLKAVQLHGKEDESFVTDLRKRLGEEVEIWKAYGVSNQVPNFMEHNIDRHLLDTQVGAKVGGTGLALTGLSSQTLAESCWREALPPSTHKKQQNKAV